MLGHAASHMRTHCVPSSSPSLDLVYLDYGCFEEGTLHSSCLCWDASTPTSAVFSGTYLNTNRSRRSNKQGEKPGSSKLVTVSTGLTH